MGHITFVGSNMSTLLETVAKLAGDVSYTSSRPVVGVIMGSDSDLPVVKPALVILRSFKVPFEGKKIFV